MGFNRQVFSNRTETIPDSESFTYEFDSVPDDPNGLKFVKEFQFCITSDQEVTYYFSWGNSDSYPHEEEPITCSANSTSGHILESVGFPRKVKVTVENASGNDANVTMDLSVWG